MGMTMSNISYGRGQVEWALWKAFMRGRSSKAPAPKMFLTRIKRLLEIDRALDLSDRQVPPETDFAFVAPPERAGSEVVFSEFDAFCLAVALDLLDAGFKQSEVVFLMRYLRGELEDRFPNMLSGPNLNAKRRQSEDGRLFLLIKKYEITEALSSPNITGHADPLFLAPEYCNGAEALARALSKAMPNHRRVITVVELAATAQAVSSFLPQAPEIRRGRPKS